MKCGKHLGGGYQLEREGPKSLAYVKYTYIITYMLKGFEGLRKLVKYALKEHTITGDSYFILKKIILELKSFI